MKRRDVALSLLDVFGDDNTGFEQVSAGLPEQERSSLRVEWLASRAEYDPFGEFREAQALVETDTQRRALHDHYLRRLKKIGKRMIELPLVFRTDLSLDDLRSLGEIIVEKG